MIWTLTAILSSICTVSQSAFTKIASSKEKTSGAMSFNALKTGASFLFFLLISIVGINFHTPTMGYAISYGIALFFSTIFGYLALMTGSMAITSLIASYSVIIPCVFGITALNESLSITGLLGIILLLVSMFLIRQNGGVQFSKKWLFYVLCTFFCNGICSVIQKLHQTVYPGEYCTEFMIFSLFATFILFFVLSICQSIKKSRTSHIEDESNRKQQDNNILNDEKNSKNQVTSHVMLSLIKYAVPAGVLMGLGNYLTLLLSSKVNATVLFPLISVFSMLCNVLVSKLYFKDKFSISQLVGICVGLVSVLLIK